MPSAIASPGPMFNAMVRAGVPVKLEKFPLASVTVTTTWPRLLIPFEFESADVPGEKGSKLMNVNPFALIAIPIWPARARKIMSVAIRARIAAHRLVLKWVDMAEAPGEQILSAPTRESDKSFQRPSSLAAQKIPPFSIRSRHAHHA